MVPELPCQQINCCHRCHFVQFIIMFVHFIRSLSLRPSPFNLIFSHFSFGAFHFAQRISHFLSFHSLPFRSFLTNFPSSDKSPTIAYLPSDQSPPKAPLMGGSSSTMNQKKCEERKNPENDSILNNIASSCSTENGARTQVNETSK